MPRSAAAHRTRDVILSEPNEWEFRKRYRDPSNKRSGTKYGEFSALVNKLLAEYFRANPVVTGQELDDATARFQYGDAFATIQPKDDQQ